MKVLIFAIILLALIITGSIFYIIALNNTAQSYVAQINNIQKLAESDKWDEVNIKLKDEIDRMKKTQDWLTTLIHHYEIDEININSARLMEFAKYKDKVNFFVESEVLKQLIKHLPEKESINFKNFF